MKFTRSEEFWILEMIKSVLSSNLWYKQKDGGNYLVRSKAIYRGITKRTWTWTYGGIPKREMNAMKSLWKRIKEKESP